MVDTQAWTILEGLRNLERDVKESQRRRECSTRGSEFAPGKRQQGLAAKHSSMLQRLAWKTFVLDSPFIELFSYT
jgi:hypothetical protein